MRKSFLDFVNNYIGTGLIVALIISVVVLIVGSIILSDQRHRRLTEKELLIALQGRAVDNKETQKAAAIIKEIRESNEPMVIMADIKKLDELRESYNFLGFFINNSEILTTASQSKLKISADSINVPKWKDLYAGLGKGSAILFILSCSINFIVVSISRGERLYDWPWKSFWTYPCFILMSPILLPAIAFEVIIKYGYFLAVGVKNNYRETRADLQQVKFLKNKELAQQQIARIKSRIDKTRKKWGEMFGPKLTQLVRSAEQGVYNTRKRLNAAGEELSLSQRAYTEARKSLSDLKRGVGLDAKEERERHMADLEYLLNLSLVKAVEVIDGILYVYTDVIYIDYAGKRYEIGIFVIKLRMDSTQVVLENLCSTHPNGDYHPYGTSGGFCWGTLTGTISTALMNKEFAVAVQHILVALQTGRGDSEKIIHKWKEVPK